MNLVHITTLYPDYIADFERRHPGISGLSFAEHRDLLYRDGYGWSNHYTRHLAKRGHQTLPVVANYLALQRKWAQEHGFNPANDPAMLAIAREQVRTAQPDALFVDDCFAFPAARIREFCAVAPSVRSVACFHGIEGDITPLVPRDALLLSPAAHLVEEWRALGYQAELLRHAFEPELVETLPPPAHQARLSFIGSCSPLLHPERHAWLSTMADKMPALEVWSDSFNIPPFALARLCLAALRRNRAARVWQHLTSPLRARIRPAVYGLPMLAQLRDSQITLNCHITLSRPSAGNMRLFEATGAGACLVTDVRDDLATILEPGSECIAYTTIADCLEKVGWLLDHPVEAAAIADRGRRRTLREHTFAHRALELETLLLDHLAGRKRLTV